MSKFVQKEVLEMQVKAGTIRFIVAKDPMQVILELEGYVSEDSNDSIAFALNTLELEEIVCTVKDLIFKMNESTKPF